MSTTRFATTTAQTAVAFALASVTALGLLSGVATLADPAHADQRLAQSTLPVAQQAPRT
jgi:hypothetical protein